jgi:preprotein translocase subunit SecG
METLVTIVHVMVCIFLMLTVLLQAGKGGGMGAAFGGGSSMGTVFGGSGAGNFLRRLTVAAAIIFMITSMTLAWMATPSTDPLKEYWAQQQAAAAEKARAHKDAVKGSEGKSGTAPATEGAAPEGAVEDEAAAEGASSEAESVLETPAGEADKAAPAGDGAKAAPAGQADKAAPSKPEAAKPEAARAEPSEAEAKKSPAAPPPAKTEPLSTTPAPSGSTP